MAKIRCFIGFRIPESVSKKAVGIQKSISRMPASCKMVEPANLHVCLSFLGNIDEKDVSGITKSLGEICSKHTTFEVTVGGLKLIPNETYVRVIALDAYSKSGSLEKISSEIKEKFSKMGGKSHPSHITLCRVRKITNKAGFLEGVRKLGPIDCTFNMDSIDIIKSELSPNGPTYSVINKIKLG